MIDPVNAWKQAGRVYLWRYPPHLKKRQRWHFTAEDDACDSLVQLVEAVRSVAEMRRRTIAITKPTQPIWGVPNFGEPRKETLGPLTLYYDHAYPDLRLSEDDDRLSLRVGNERIDDLLTGLRDVRRGEGDYAFAPSERTQRLRYGPGGCHGAEAGNAMSAFHPSRPFRPARRKPNRAVRFR